MSPSEFESSPMSADEALERASNWNFRRPAGAWFREAIYVLRQATTYRALAEIKHIARNSRAA